MDNRNSTFVTVLAWVLIIFSGFGLVISIFQNILLNTTFPIEEFENAITTDADDGIYTLIYSNFRLIIALVGLMILTFFISSIALLKRKNWSRISLSILFSIGILHMVFSILMQFYFIVGDEGLFDIGDPFFWGILFIAFFGISMISLLLWLIFKLNSSKIKAEFIGYS
ncbi:hypothetical protein [Chondrinema litorale]|uniref:hypothetical protein n=1 Tax=Chondrinema litorale TaxID=2994555 RepID=UPI002543445B|nr:hypothetical protein [Chondrinema litorale]UZR96142.1 hypothetical protein OQ292_10020 [Chondrinema litorale]